MQFSAYGITFTPPSFSRLAISDVLSYLAKTSHSNDITRCFLSAYMCLWGAKGGKVITLLTPHQHGSHFIGICQHFYTLLAGLETCLPSELELFEIGRPYSLFSPLPNSLVGSIQIHLDLEKAERESESVCMYVCIRCLFAFI